MSGIVKYARLVNLGNYENERVEFEDYVRPDETPEDAYTRVRVWVHQQLDREDPLRDYEGRLNALRGKVFDAEEKVRKVRLRWEKAVASHGELRALLERHGVTIEPLPAYLALSAVDEQDALSSEDNPF